MRRAVLFLSKFVISLWTILVVSFLSLLIFNAPNVPNTAPFAEVSIKTNNGSTIHLPNRIFNCTETGQEFQCQANIQDRLLKLTLTKGSEYKYDLSNCRALYNNQPIDCSEKGQTYAPIIAKIYEITNPELTPQQLQAVRQKYWGINALKQFGELGLMWISTGLSLVAGLNAAFLAWFYPGKLSKAFASLVCGFGMYRFVWGLLGRVQFDVVTPYGFTPDSWSWVVDGGALIAGVGTLIATALVLWRRFHRFIRLPMSISSSVGIFNLCSFSLLWIFTYLPSLFGFTETLLQNRSVLMWVGTTISSTFAIVAAILFYLHTNQSIKKFLCLSSGIGAVALAINLFLFVLLGLGYAD
ncbi:MAG: hypothetical protein KME32_19925 [Mojavia pulchra JT2-VF2]|jgi:hypothetical protein|uniref:Uncharacterized protein n=1 Tax=Mojavia pulchra JT2-VF2 TaxID=287848 RepID=A0A951Q2Z5_9NOST|nr:hypothetical protein [Mojavia pulchra JT2-VF2]